MKARESNLKLTDGKKDSGFKKKALKMIFVILGIVVVLWSINFLPTFHLKTKDMDCFEGKWIDVYYQQEGEAAYDVFQYADTQIEAVANKLGYSEKQDINIYIYDTQSMMQAKKYGYLGPLLGLDWYIGDNIGTNVILTSPANPGTVHSYDDVKYAVLHEIIHAYISVIKPDIHLWLTEGTALYLSNGNEFYQEYLNYTSIPTFRDTCTRNPLIFSKCGGYIFASTYIEYIDVTYGWNNVLKLIETEDYMKCFEKSQNEIYDEWVLYLENYYQ